MKKTLSTIIAIAILFGLSVDSVSAVNGPSYPYAKRSGESETCAGGKAKYLKISCGYAGCPYHDNVGSSASVSGTRGVGGPTAPGAGVAAGDSGKPSACHEACKGSKGALSYGCCMAVCSARALGKK